MLTDHVLGLLKTDHELYAERCLKIVDETGELVPFVYRPSQKKVARAIQWQRSRNLPVRINVGKSRKTGVSTGGVGIAMNRATLIPNRRALIVGHNSDTAGELFDIGNTMYANLPAHIDPRLKPPLAYSSNSLGRKMMWWGNKAAMTRGEGDRGIDSRLNIDTAQEVEAGRGKTIHDLLCTEIAFWPDRKKALALLNAVPDVPGTMVLAESTANGFNFWKDHWDRAERGEGRFINVFIGWTEDPQCTAPFPDEDARARFVESVGRGSKGLRAVTADEPWLIEKFAVTPEQLYWRRLTIADKCDGDVDKFRQEFPSCLTGETRVSTERGIIPIAEAADSLLTESGPIKHWGPQVASPIYRLMTRQGRVIRGTFDHPVQTEGGLVGIRDLQPGARLRLRRPRFAAKEFVYSWSGPLRSEHSVRVSADMGRWIGYFMGDGSWYKDTLSFACDGKDLDVVDEIASLTTFFVGEPKPRTIRPVKGRRGCIELRLGCKFAREFMQHLGLIATSPAGSSYRREVCVPECIWRSPQPVVREFLRGLFEADGSASANKVRWATSHEQFARDVQLLMLGFGINAPIQKVVKPNGRGYKYTNWTISLNVADSKVFHDEIGFIGARKSALRPREQTLGRKTARRELWDEVESVEIDGFEVTYDFTLDNAEHLFMANGILTHNTSAEMFVGSGRHVFPVKLQRSALDSAELYDREGVEGVFIPSGHTVRRLPNGTVEVPTGALWVPWEKTGFADDHAFWKLWVPHEGQEALAAPGDRQFVEAVDPAGTNATVSGGDPDSWAIQIIDHHSLEQAAVWRGRLDTDQIAEQAFLAYLFFNEALTAVEVTGGWGNSLVDDYLSMRYGHKRLYRRQRPLYAKDQSASQSTVLGWSTDRKTKPELLDGGRELLREGTHGIKHMLTALQITTFVWNEKNQAGADHSAHDDLLMAWLIAQQVARLVRPRPKLRPRVTSSVPRIIRRR